MLCTNPHRNPQNQKATSSRSWPFLPQQKFDSQSGFHCEMIICDVLLNENVIFVIIGKLSG